MRTSVQALAGCLLFQALAAAASAQTFDAVGTRAAGMGGAFVAVADDASAAYWNPAGFASGAIMSLVLDRSASTRSEAGPDPGGRQSGWLLALGAPALGLSYYRLRSVDLQQAAVAAGEAPLLRAERLVTHHAGATLVQSIGGGIAVGATLKMVRGQVSSATAPVSRRGDLLEEGGGSAGEAGSRFDADLGVMAVLGRLKAGVTLRNATEPSFRGAAGGPTLSLARQARAGISVTPLTGWLVAADMDVTGPVRPSGARRFAVGAEGRVHRRLVIRGGVNAAASGDRRTGASAGASLAATASVLIDASVTGGSGGAPRGWGIAARVGY